MAYVGNNGGIYNLGSSSSAKFTLLGGQYGVTAIATFGGGSVTLQAVGPDGSTLVTVLTAFTTNGYATVTLPAGQYQFTVTTATVAFASILPIAHTGGV